MKAIKRISVILMCVCLVLCSVCVTAFSETQTGSITIESTSEVSIIGRTFHFYKIFNAEKATSVGGEEIVSYQWDAETKAECEKFFFGENGAEGKIPGKTSGTIHDVADYIRSLDGNNSAFSKFATDLYNYILNNTVLKDKYEEVKATTSTLVVDNLPLGYYMIYDATTLSDTNQVRSAVMLTTPGENKSIKIKADLPTISKTVVGNDDVEQKGTSATIGDCVKFIIRTAIPDHSLYQSYTFSITDTMPSGLTFVENNDEHPFTVKANGTALTKDTDYTFNYDSTNNKFTVELLNVSKSYDNNDEIVIEYHTLVNDNAVKVNDNSVTLTYSSDPTDNTKLGTAESKASVYLYQLVLTKYAEHTDGAVSATRLAGAKFKLYEKGSNTAIKFRVVKETNADGKEFDVYYVDPDGTVEELSTIDDTSYGASNTINGGGFADLKIFGLCEGDYELEETVAPDGYVVPNYRFQISIKDEIGKSSGVITALNLTTTTVEAEGQTGGNIVNAGFSIADQAIWASVTNATGSALPETGGIGTTVFTVAGIILMAGALAFFTSRKRSSAA